MKNHPLPPFALGHSPFIIAKIERARALEHLDNIFEAAGGIMIARGDLGVETSIEQIAVVQKQLMRKWVWAGKSTQLTADR